jgi:FAD/FMN-containing dehydrogenase
MVLVERRDMKISGWGRYPVIDAEALFFEHDKQASEVMSRHGSFITHGRGRSYGDSAVAKRVLMTHRFNCILDFSPETGVAVCEAGVTLADLIEAFFARGWFLRVTPGTKFITVGGAIASDVHGKNHHVAGCFSECVEWFDLLLPDGFAIRCDRENNAELFRATCGGMGLTGVILRAAIRLKRVNGAWIDQVTYKAKNLHEALRLFEENSKTTYSVAWIDCLASGESLGRALLMVGETSETGGLELKRGKELSMPFDLPGFALNRLSVSAFNSLYYGRIRDNVQKRHVYFEPFFYPLDAIHNWNRIYGSNGFMQYQFSLPKESSLQGLTTALKKTSDAGLGSFLAVLKLFGDSNANPLSFPMMGYTLALDFKIEKKLFGFLAEMDKIVLDHGGRIYLTKDARMTREVFDKGYPRADEFRALRERYAMKGKLESVQSLRLEL